MIQEKKEIKETLIKIASFHNPEIPLGVIEKHVVQHIDILEKYIDKYGVITNDSIKGLHEAFSKLPELKLSMSQVHPGEVRLLERGREPKGYDSRKRDKQPIMR